MSKKLTVYIDENITYLTNALISQCEVNLSSGRKLNSRVLISSPIDALFIRSTTKINKQLLDNTNVKFVGSATSGIDHVDTNYLKENNIHFAYAPGSNANSVAELVVYAMFKWSLKKKIDLKNKTIGIIGFGNIGKIVSRYADYLGMKVLVNDPPLKDDGFKFPDNIIYSGLEDLCGTCDIISNHLPLTKNGKYPTYNLLNQSRINLIPEGGLIIHTSRGTIIEEQALIHRLKRKELEAVIDVWENEPFINKELVDLSLLATPHIGGYSLDGKLRGVLAMADSFSHFAGIKCDLSEINKLLSEYKPAAINYYHNPEKLYRLLKDQRKFDDDDRLLRSTIYLKEEERALAFDNLRKNYEQRRESL